MNELLVLLYLQTYLWDIPKGFPKKGSWRLASWAEVLRKGRGLEAVVSKKYRPDPRSVPRYFFVDRYRTAIHFLAAGTERDRNG